jgi:AP2 domain/HNH endonuclease
MSDSFQIELTQGQVAVVDEMDFPSLSQWKWFAKWNKITRSYYAYRKEDGKLISMARQIMKAEKGEVVDHKDHDTLNNRRCNLRRCTKAQNSWNQRVRRNNTSGFKGVCWNKNSKKWLSYITVNRRMIYVGGFNTPQEAGKAYAEAAAYYYGEFSGLL